MNFPQPPPVPGLIRRPVCSSPQPISQDPRRFPSTSNLQLPSDGVVVVGFLSRRPDDSSQLINQIVDSNTFGSGNTHKILTINKAEAREWFRFRRISYYHDEEKGIVFVHFSPTLCPALDAASGFDSLLEQRELGDLQGLLFMFSVCHVIINIQEGSRFDTRLLKKFRILQASKQALAPYVRSQAALPLTSRPHSSLHTFPQPRSVLSRGGGIVSRGASSVSLKSGGGSYTSLFPGQCNPVTLFVFLDNFSDMSKSSFSVDGSTTTSSVSDQSVNAGKLTKSELPTKNSGSVVVLSRPGSKYEGGLRKKLQSSLEAQIRFLIKKCRTLTGSDINRVGSRSGNISSASPLFSLDASKAVVLLDRSTNKKGGALEFATSLVDDVLNGKANPDSLLLENNCQMSTKEDVLCVKEFIYRCSDILRGKGGLAANSSSAGVGMVAVAAAAAAASTSSRKTYSARLLPQLDEWLSGSHQILDGIITAKIVSTDEIDLGKKKSHERNMSPVKDEARSSTGGETLDTAVSLLVSGKGLNLKFSSLWCERAFPAAKDMYLKDLPACYPTLVHETHLQKALHTLRSMVRGPSVQLFTERLKDECICIWESGRQLCDATSLTGKPCLLQRHNMVDEQFIPGAEVKSHSSGYVFLHACACGRSRRLRGDPFDFDSANISFNCFPDCDKLLPCVKLPEIAHEGPIKSSSWSFVRVGDSRYYDPSKGLLQSGFSAIQKFLIKLVLSSLKDDAPNGFQNTDSEKASISRSNVTMTRTSRTNIDSAPVTAARVTREQSVDNGSKKVSFGRGLPNLLMRKPFSEVVAGSKSTDLSFPPLQSSRQPLPALAKVVKQKSWNCQIEESIDDSCNQECQESKDISRDKEIFATVDDLTLQNGRNVVPVNVKVAEKVMSKPMQKPLIAYIGFEHECPHGHRFLLNSEHLANLGPSYSVPEEHLDNNFAERPPKSIVYGKGRRKSNRMTSGMNRMKNMDRSDQMVSKDNTIPGRKSNRASGDTEPIVNSTDDYGVAFSMLNRHLPIFMKCPHCSVAFGKKDSSNIMYAGTISQLQRIFLVTPHFPVVLATCPVINFEESCLHPSIPDREQKLQFGLGCPVILPPDSFLSLRLPFVYGVQLEDGTQVPLMPSEQEPEKTAWIVRGTILQFLTKENNLDEKVQT